ncbi:MAG: response regulator [Spirochaetales bacterium]|nr:response regulator [Spirochaetales bacterium]
MNSTLTKQSNINISIKILIVDDEITMDKLIRKIFRKEQRQDSYVFHYLNSADDAYSYLSKNNDVDIILMDINMPGKMNGLDLLSKVKEINPLIKTIIISAYGDMERSRSAMQLGAFDFIQKPLDQEDLKFSVKRAVEYVSEAKKVAKLLLEVDVLNYMVKNDVIDYVRNETAEPQQHDESRKEKASILVASIHCPEDFFYKENAEIIIRKLNQYFTIVTRNIHYVDGYIDSFVGTTCYAVLVGSGSLLNVFPAARNILDQVNKLETLGALENAPYFGMSLGIDYGEITIGNVGSTDPIRLERRVSGPPLQKALSLALNGPVNSIRFIHKHCFDFVFHQFHCQEEKEGTGIFEVLEPAEL